MNQIEIRTRNNLVYADIPVWSATENKYLKAVMLIDTGANTTAFADSALKKLGCYNEDRKTTVRTASGYVEVHIISLSKIQLGDTELCDVETHAHSYLDDFHFDGILGMNVLRQFNLEINFDNSLLTINKRTI
jgi:predicted aspartyl protease